MALHSGKILAGAPEAAAQHPSNPGAVSGCRAEADAAVFAQKRRHTTQRRRRRRPEKRACSETMEESSSPADEADARRMRARFYLESSHCSLIHIQSDTSLHLHITTFRARDCSASVHSAEQPRSRRVCWSSSGRRAKSGSRHTRQRPRSSRTTQRPRIQAVIQDGVTACLLPKHPLETRLAAVIGRALSTYFDALDDEDKATAKLYVQEVVQPADEAWQQTTAQTRQCQPSNIPTPPLRMMTAMTWIFLRPLGRADSVHRSSKRSFRGCLTLLVSGV